MRTTPQKLILNSHSKLSSLTSSNVPLIAMPALLTRMSTPACSAITAFGKAATA